MASVDPLSLEAFERRAKEADERLRALESQFESLKVDRNGSGGHPALEKVLKELKVLESKLVDAKLKNVEIEKENTALKEQKSKLDLNSLLANGFVFPSFPSWSETFQSATVLSLDADTKASSANQHTPKIQSWCTE
eukprot:jgi/Pico_ML_1/52391/g3101.t1